MQARGRVALLGLGLGLALALLAALIWWMPSSGESRRATDSAAPIDGVEARHGHGAGVGARTVDPAGTPARIVAGQLIDPESGPLTDGRVDLWCDDHRPGARLPVDEDGRFAGPACAGQTCARLVHPSFQQPRAWILDGDAVQELEVVRAAGASGSVRSTSGDPVPDASLLLRTPLDRASARTDAAGEFAVSIPELRPCDTCDSPDAVGRCRLPEVVPTERQASLLVWAPGFAPRELEVVLGRADALDIELSAPAAPIVGTVLARDGRPLGPRTVVLATNLECDAEQHAATVEPDGSFELADLAEADYGLRVVRDGQELARRARVGAGESVELRAELDARHVDVDVVVVDAAGRPASGVRVDGGPLRGAVTDAMGRVSAGDVLPGDYELRVRAPSCPVIRAKLEIDAGAGSPRRELIRLPDAC